MKNIYQTMNFGFALLMSGLLSVCVQAAPNENARNNKGQGDNSEVRHETTVHFDDHHRVIITEYFATEARRGNCPPGLAKKNNGCTPPGQAKRWQVGRALPSDVVYYDLPSALLLQLGAAPSGYRYAGVDDDVLLIELGTQLVVDVINALSQ